jgi:branched-chain amino acid aminotransferase
MFIFNGTLYTGNDPVIHPNNRSFLYGDGIFETIRLIGGNPLFLHDHFKRFSEGLEVLGLSGQLNTFEAFKSAVMMFKDTAKIQNARVKVVVSRTGTGFYTPDGTGYDYLTSATDGLSSRYEAGPGLTAGIFSTQTKSPGALSSLKSTSALLYVMAARAAALAGCDDNLLLNAAGRVIESSRSNLFVVQNEKLITSPLSEGCLNGVMRKQVIRLLKTVGTEVAEAPLRVTDLENANEILLTNVVQGVQWVRTLGEKSYTNLWSLKLTELLNSDVKSAGLS